MKVLIRESIAGSEYWDTEQKKTIFLAKGEIPNFEVTVNPESMISPLGEQTIVAVDFSEDKDKTVVTEMVQTGDGNLEILNSQVIDADKSVDEEPSELDNMNVKQLRAYAKKNNIDIPAAIRVKGDILEIIKEAK